MKNFISAVGLCFAVAAISTAGAEDAQKLDPVISTASRITTPLDQTIGTATIITREDIERLQPRDLPDLLRTLPGVAVSQTGGRGQTTTVFVRGNESRHTLVLINGRRAGAVQFQPSFSYEYVPVDDIERIEFVPGARSSLYGSEALGGVINIITRRDTGTAVRAGVGTQGSQDISVHTGWSNPQFTLGVDAGTERTDGYDATVAPTNPDDDGYDAHRLGLHAGAKLGAVQLALDGFHNQGRSEFDGFGTGNDFRLDQESLGAGYAVAERTQLQFDAGYSRDQRLYTGFFTDSQRRSASLQLTQGFLHDSSVTGGFDYVQDLGRGGVSNYNERITRAVFVNALPRFGAFSLEAGLRYERDAAYGSITTGQLGLRYALSADASVYARGGNAFRAPSFEERYGAPFAAGPNPALKPEKTQSAEVGGTLYFAGVHTTLSLYRNQVRDLISYSDPNGSTGTPPFFSTDGDEQYINLSRTRMQGVELQFDTRLLETDLSAGLGYLDARDSSTHAVLVRRPHATAHLDADRRFGAFSLGASLIGEGHRPDAFGSQDSGFGLLNLRAAWMQSAALSWELSGTNVLDHDYSTANGFRGQPLTVRLGVVLHPGS